ITYIPIKLSLPLCVTDRDIENNKNKINFLFINIFFKSVNLTLFCVSYSASGINIATINNNIIIGNSKANIKFIPILYKIKPEVIEAKQNPIDPHILIFPKTTPYFAASLWDKLSVKAPIGIAKKNKTNMESNMK